jgi:hypothetical protein
MPNDGIMTQKDLQLLDHLDDEGNEKKPAAEVDKGGGDKVADEAGGDKKSDEESGKREKSYKDNDRGGLFDNLDDDDEGGDDKAADTSKDKVDEKSADSKADDKGGKKEDEKPADKDEKKSDDGDDKAWREELADRLLKGQEDKLTAAKLAKARASILNDLSRFKTRLEYDAAGFHARQRIRSGELRSPRPQTEDAAELAAWRKANDIPEKHDAYVLPEVKGHDWTKETSIDIVLGAAHEADVTQKQIDHLAKALVDHGKAVEQDMEEKMLRQDREDRDAVDDDIRVRHGLGEFKAQKAVLQRLLKDDEVFPDGAGDTLAQARYYDPETGLWRKVLNHPTIANAMLLLAKHEYGEGGFVPGEQLAKADGRVEDLEKLKDSDYEAFMRVGANGKSPADELLELKREKEARDARRGRRAA